MTRLAERRKLTGTRRAFSLMEVLVACVIFSLIMIAMLTMVSQTSSIWRSSNARIDAFQGARRAFETLTELLSQATLNTYWGYDDASTPSRYIRKSELQFVVLPAGGTAPGTPRSGQGIFFQAPAAKSAQADYERLTGLLNPCGFYVEYGSDAAWLPPGPIPTTSRDRYRLMLWIGDTESEPVFREETDPSDALDWVKPSPGNVFPLADNIILLAVWPRDETRSAILDSYAYNSRSGIASNPQPATANQLPPVLQIAMVAVSESSLSRLDGENIRSTIDSCLQGLFESAPRQNYEKDLGELEKRLTDEGINYRVFSSAIPLREAKWSEL